MKTLMITTGGAAILAAAALNLAPAASAVPLEGSPADVVVSSLQARGFTVQVNGTVSNGASPGSCASMHVSNAQGHAQCSGEVQSGSHASCDPTGMPSSQCDQMAAYMGGRGMTSFCH